MKKITFFATAFMLIFGMVSLASATAKFTTDATTSLNGILFSPSTNVGLSTTATATAWAAAAKHETGGTTMYGLLSTDTNMKMQQDMDKAAAVTSQTDATALQGDFE